MDQNVSPAKSGLPLGILFGIIMVLEVVISYIVGLQTLAETSFGLIINFLNYLILPAVFIYLGCTNYKNKLNHGFVSFSQCLKIGVTTTFIAALIFALFNIVFINVFPDYATETMEFAKSEMIRKQPTLTPEQIEMQMSFAKKFTEPYIFIPVVLVMYAFIGLLYSLIIGAIVKKEQPQSF